MLAKPHDRVTFYSFETDLIHQGLRSWFLVPCTLPPQGRVTDYATRPTSVTKKGKFNSINRHTVTIDHSHGFIYQPPVHFPPHPSLSPRLSRQRAKMLVTPVFAFLSLAFNFGALLLLHGSDPNFVTTRRNLQSSIQTIELAATETWSAIAVHYKNILSPPPASSSFSLVGHVEWIYRGCAVRILRSLDGSVSNPSCALSPSSSLVSSPSLSSTPLSITTDLTLYTPLPPTCSISNAPFVVDHVEHPWETLGFMEINFPRFWLVALCILVSSAVYIWFKVVRSSQFFISDSLLLFQDRRPSDTPDIETGLAYEAYSIDSAAGSVRVDSNSTPSLSLKSGMNSKPRIFANTADTSLPSLPIIITTSCGRVLFNAEFTLSSNRIISTSPSSLEFSVDVVAFRDSSFRKSHFPPPPHSQTHSFNSLRRR